LTIKIAKMVADHRSASLVRVKSRDTRKLWSAVKPTVCKLKSTCSDYLFDSLDSVNKHFVDIATDAEYYLFGFSKIVQLSWRLLLLICII
jgi:hypothetical protein